MGNGGVGAGRSPLSPESRSECALPSLSALREEASDCPGARTVTVWRDDGGGCSPVVAEDATGDVGTTTFLPGVRTVRSKYTPQLFEINHFSSLVLHMCVIQRIAGVCRQHDDRACARHVRKMCLSKKFLWGEDQSGPV